MSAIKVGDLVMVVRLLPCGHGALGRTFRVPAVGLSSPAGIICSTCKRLSPQARVVLWPTGTVTELSRLIKIDPPAQPESVERKEEVSV